MKEYLDLFRYVLAPENDWQRFVRKLLNLVVALSLGALAFGMYKFYTTPAHREQPVQAVLDRSRDKQEVIRSLLEMIYRSDPAIKSVWLFSRPDTLQLQPVMYVGDSTNPLPSGTLERGDEYSIGAFLFGDCVEISRDFYNFSCPVNGIRNSWGVIVVSYEGEPQLERGEQFIYGVSQRIRTALYVNKAPL